MSTEDTWPDLDPEEVAGFGESATATLGFLRTSVGRYELGTDDHFARRALDQALLALIEGNYGIGAVAVVVDEIEVREHHVRNAMLTGLGVVDHAETRAILAARGGGRPQHAYPRATNEATVRLPLGVSVHGTLEPCPMCACALTNGGVVRSVSTVVDGQLVDIDGVATSDGGSSVLGAKWLLQPYNWRWLQEATGVRFELLEPRDRELAELSWRLFADTGHDVDRRLAQRRLGDRVVRHPEGPTLESAIPVDATRDGDITTTAPCSDRIDS
jgi:tRNA(Arg) A34 adenosine deaminase TadA